MEQPLTLTCNELSEEGITTEIVTKAIIFQLGEEAVNLHKRVAELETMLTPNTPHKVLESRWKEVTKNA